MRVMKIGLAFCIFLLIASHAQAQKVTTDYDHKANFEGYKTFMWIKPPTVRQDPLMDQRLTHDVNAALTAKGWQEVPEGADVGIVAHVATQQEQTLDTFYNGFGDGWGWRFGGGFGEATTTPETYTVGTLVIDLFDAHTKQLIWRSVATDTISDKPEKDSEQMRKAVDKMFKDFPPKRA